MALQEQSVAEQLIDARERYVARGAGNPEARRGWRQRRDHRGPDGREYLDFVGGIGCQNLGHGPEKVVAAVHAQVDRFLHQMSMVVSYEGYVDVCRLLAENSPCAGASKSMLINSGAEAIENAVKISRAATGRPAVLVFDRAFHGRTLLAMTMTSKLVYKKTFGPFAPEIYRVAAPYEYRGISSDDAIEAIELAFKTDVDPESVACAVLEPVQGEGGFIPMPLDFPARLKELLDRYGILYVDDEIQSGCGRTGTMWAIEHYGVAARPRGVRQDARRRPAAGGRDRPRRGHGRAAHRRARRHVRRQPRVLRRGHGRARGARPSRGAAPRRRASASAARRARRRAEPDRRGRRRARPRPDARDRARHRPHDEGARGRARHAHDRRSARPRPAADGLGHLLERASASCRRSTSRTRSSSAASRSSRSRWSRPGRRDEQTVRVAGVQAAPVFLDADATVAKAVSLIEEAASRRRRSSSRSRRAGCRGIRPGSSARRAGRTPARRRSTAASARTRWPCRQPATDTLCRAARASGVVVVMGMTERDTDTVGGSLYNSLLYISAEGAILGVHRKLMPTHAERIVWGQGDGSGLLVVETAGRPGRRADLLGALDAARALRDARRARGDPRRRLARGRRSGDAPLREPPLRLRGPLLLDLRDGREHDRRRAARGLRAAAGDGRGRRLHRGRVGVRAARDDASSPPTARSWPTRPRARRRSSTPTSTWARSRRSSSRSTSSATTTGPTSSTSASTRPRAPPSPGSARPRSALWRWRSGCSPRIRTGFKSRVRGRGARSERERIPARRSGWNPFESRDPFPRSPRDRSAP